jgi:hypothetical protein
MRQQMMLIGAYREISAEMAIERAKEERYCNRRKW